MTSRPSVPAMVAMVAMLVLAGGSAAVAAERYEDAVGDATGSAPDIVACTISEPDDGPVVAISVEFASEPPLETDMETYTDVVFIDLASDPDPALTDEENTDYIFGAHAVTLPEYLGSGAHLHVAEGPGDLYWHVVDVAIDGSTVTWTVDRKLIGDPDLLSWHVLAGVEREEGAEAAEDEWDECPDGSRGSYTLTKAWR